MQKESEKGRRRSGGDGGTRAGRQRGREKRVRVADVGRERERKGERFGEVREGWGKEGEEEGAGEGEGEGRVKGKG